MDRKTAKTRIDALKKEINRYRYAYHVHDEEVISQSALDSLKKELFDLETEFPELVTPDSPTQRIGGKPLPEFKKIKHEARMLSFNDAFSEKDMSDWFLRLENYLGYDTKPDFYCELKIDGLAIELIYENGIFVQGSTRGDGHVGEDVTQNLKTIEAIPLKLTSSEDAQKIIKESGLNPSLYNLSPKRLVVRGEIFLSTKEFARINKEAVAKGEKSYANPRNVAAGSIRQLDPRVVAGRKLDSFEYAIVTDLGQKVHEEEHIILKALGFKTNPHNKLVHALNDVYSFRNYWDEHREKLVYEIDGVVVIANNNATFGEGGVAGKAPRGAIAYKFSPIEATTIVNNIFVQVGRTGALTPVAELEPVLVGGVTIRHATLHNYDEIKRLGVKIGDTVIINRAGDVIPKITSVLPKLRTGKEKEFRMPKKCPMDGAPVVKDGVAYRCSNPKCGARRRETLYHFVSRGAFDMRGLGPKIIDRFLDEGLIADAADIFSLYDGDIKALPRFGEKSAEKIVTEIYEKKATTLARFIYSLGIFHVGEETARTLSDEAVQNDAEIKTPKDVIAYFKAFSKEKLMQMEDVGPKVAESIYEWFHDAHNAELLNKFYKGGVEIQMPKRLPKAKATFKGKTFVLTGTLETMTRDEAKEKVRGVGGDVAESVSKQTNYVVAGENAGSKLKRAGELGVTILSEREFIKMLKN
ncbi:MAG: NAD-dependent DNA ligase LigA [Candidatus Jorgensenbacteria bacterium]|nr:NAD-dependent DNA ligase LigA [Candidatus Jorgensenbacteria bacterium]